MRIFHGLIGLFFVLGAVGSGCGSAPVAPADLQMPCRDDSACSGRTPRCDRSTGLCVVCLVDWQKWNGADDQPLYFLLAKKVLEQGSLYDPFDVRRLSTFGGQTYLQATFAAVSPMFYMNMLDSGAFGVVVVGLIVGAFTTRGLRPAHVVPLGAGLALYVFLLGVRLNTTSLYTGVAAYLGIYRTLHFSPTRGVDRRPTWPIDPRLLVVIALLTVTCYVLRTSNVVAVCTFVGVLLLSAYFSGARAPMGGACARRTALPPEPGPS